jgi:hypothetical protein
MLIGTPRVEPIDDSITRVSTTVGDFELWYEVPAELSISDGGEFIACAALLPSMQLGEPLVLPADRPIDPVFRDNLELAQEHILRGQDRLGARFSRIRIEAAIRSTPPVVAKGALAFFSGGVDGSYTAFTNRQRISMLLLLRGIDMQLENEELWQAAVEGGRAVAESWGLPLLTLSTNVRFLGYHHGLKWSRTFQGAGLASVAHLVPHPEVLVAASHSLHNMVGYASSPEMDPLWNSSVSNFEHDGAVPRTTKIAALAGEAVVLERLRVCWHDQGYNCCRCEKCIRTMIALRLLGAPMPSFPEQLDLGLVDVMGSDQGGSMDYIEELDALEREHPDPEVRRALDRLLAAESRRTRLRKHDRKTGGLLSATRRLVRKLR